MRSRLLVVMCLGFFMTSCASYFKRKECEKTNWFQHGQDVAMQGKNLENDNFLRECRKVEAEISEAALDQGFKKGRANYCEPETVFLTGKKGEVFQPDMCDGSNLRLLKQKHAAGVKEYCQPDNGENAGATGKPYLNVCPKELEAKFLTEFKKGRKKYLQAEIITREQKISDMDQEIADINEQKMRKMYELSLVGGGGQKKTIRRSNNSAYGSSVEEITTDEDPALKTRRESIKSDIDHLEYQTRTKRQEQTTVREEIRKLRAEMLTL